MQNKLGDIVDLVWDLADISLEYGHISYAENGKDTQIINVCGLKCEFRDNDIISLQAGNIDLRLHWNSMRSANDNVVADLDDGIDFSEIFPNSVTFIRGDFDTLQKWHKDLSILRGALVA